MFSAHSCHTLVPYSTEYRHDVNSTRILCIPEMSQQIVVRRIDHEYGIICSSTTANVFVCGAAYSVQRKDREKERRGGGGLMKQDEDFCR